LDRHAEPNLQVAPAQILELPVIEWASIGQAAPRRIEIGPRRPDDPLPLADIVLETWTSAEWSALDHVFLNSDKPRRSDETEWRKAWHFFSRDVGSFVPDAKSGALWGWFQMVEISDRSGRPWRVLLFKSNSHLAHPPWIEGLSAITRILLEDTNADRIYSIGTAGGARPDQKLGDSVVINCAQLELQRPQNCQDEGNGAMYRCHSWYPASALVGEVERSLLYHMNRTVTYEALTQIFDELKAKHPGDPEVESLKLDDFLDDTIRPEALEKPVIQMLENVPLLTTDYYYIDNGSGSPYSFLEMDDAVIAREAEHMGARYAFVRNISDPIVVRTTKAGKPIADNVRDDWSGMIYNRYGLLTSLNGALSAWATIAGEGCAQYEPRRCVDPTDADDPLEVKLAYQVRTCGACPFFWPEKKNEQTYGPYTAYDFNVNAPFAAVAPPDALTSPWVFGHTRPPAFPEAAILDGCWKAPIMTIGINPNLTAFSPGQTGASWCYPSFSSNNGTSEWSKYAWYFRHRSVYQERLTLDFVRRFILPEGRIQARAPGHITAAARPDDNPTWTVHVRYDGDPADTEITLPGKIGDFPYMLLFDVYPPHNAFQAGDVIAGRLAVPEGIRVEVQQQQQGYYMQFVPVLKRFEKTLEGRGVEKPALRIGEDVCQLDMVACASPHWNPGFLGGTPEAVQAVVDACVTRNAWAIKQFLLVRPAVLYIVSERSWDMFHDTFGAFIKRDPPLPDDPDDGDYTLLRATTDSEHPCRFVFETVIDGKCYSVDTRIVITPHFSYNDKFLPQYRMSQEDWRKFSESEPECAKAMMPANGFTVTVNPDKPEEFVAIKLPADRAKAEEARAWLERTYPSAYAPLEPYYYDPHAMMAGVLDDLLDAGALSWQQNEDGRGYLARAEGPCRFCDNRHWQLPFGCAYGNGREPLLPAGFMEKVAEQVVAGGKP
jgi:hypothetical protein